MERPLRKHTGASLDLSTGRALGERVAAEISPARNTELARILIADDYPIFRDGLRMLLETQREFRVVGTAADGEETIRLVGALRPDVLLLDLAIRRCPGLETLREMGRFSTSVRTIILAGTIESAEIAQIIRLGARALVLKHSATQVLFECVHTVMAGRYWIASESLPDLMQGLSELLPSMSIVGSRFGLTARELEIIAAVVAGYTNKDIALKFSISAHTVKNHLTSIFNKLGVSNRLELTLYNLEHRLTSNGWVRRFVPSHQVP